MSTLTTEGLHEGQEKQGQAAAAGAEEGLIELGAVSDTRGGLLGWFQDIGNGWSFSF
jgi:hypothetical protein